MKEEKLKFLISIGYKKEEVENLWDREYNSKRNQKEEKELSDLYNWLDNVAGNCKWEEDPDIVAIPTSLTKCKKTGDVCNYYSCPLKDEQR